MSLTIGSAGGAMPVPSPKLATSLGLRDETWKFPDEMTVAWEANGHQAVAFHREAVRAALLEFWRQKRSLSGRDLLQYVEARHPRLFNFAVNEHSHDKKRFTVLVDGRIVATVPQRAAQHYQTNVAPALRRIGRTFAVQAANEICNMVSSPFPTKFA